ncbi:DUF7594 domain-containing protein [Paenibacillus flagellatus]|uniref:Fibronectin type-III domain-containing protein n=1 Tax=Paenibacillus flagellatus TaxID=2211139 RepID=A0A2V5K2T3_9BACL|nr:DNRLRE domain-containing protein [Paenibacillus flagellatus]PYI53518.1 hypothetical protein DLM86_17280 [Paenibacillus flagellatus]
MKFDIRSAALAAALAIGALASFGGAPALAAETAPPPPVSAEVDVQTVRLAPADDTFVRGGSFAADVYGSGSTLTVKTSSPDLTRETYMKFDLRHVSGTIRSAKLFVYGSVTEAAGSIDVQVHEVADDRWSESGMSWNDKPAVGTVVGSVYFSNSAQWRETDVSAYAAAEFARDRIVSVAMRQVRNPGLAVSINSKENAANRPYLEVTYTPIDDTRPPVWPAGSAATVGRSAAGEPVLRWTPAADDQAVTDYRIIRNGAPVATVTGSTYEYGLGGLTDGAVYRFAVEAGDPAGNWTTGGPSVDYAAPTVIGLSPSDDAYVNAGGSAGSNYGADPLLRVKHMDNDPNLTRESFLRFDLSSFAGELGSAKLRLYGAVNDGTGSAVDVQFYGIDGDGWSEKDVTWNTRPSRDHFLANVPMNKTYRWVDIDVTAFVRKQLATDRAAGFAIAESAPTGLVVTFNSKENAANRPVLVLSSERAVESAPSWPSGGELSVSHMDETELTLNWSAAVHPSGVTGYRVYRNGALVAELGGGTTSYTASGLTAGETYTFKVEAGGAANGWSQDGPYVTAKVPVTEIVQTAIGNVFLETEPIRFVVKTARPSVRWSVTDVHGTPIASGTSVPANGEAVVTVPVAKRGYFDFRVEAESAGVDPVILETSFAILSESIPEAAESPFGVATHLHRAYAGWTAELSKLIRYAGIDLVRDGMEWSATEKTKGQYSFASPDVYMARLKADGRSFLFVSGFNNPYYDNNSTPYTDEGRQGFADYVKAYIEHYGDEIDAVEVYNEFNIGFGDRGNGPADSRPDYYFALLKKTYETVKASRPDLPVVGMATADAPLGWIEEVLKLGGMQYLDAISVHPYRYPLTPEGLAGVMEGLNTLIRTYNGGEPKPVWISEIGWPTHVGGNGVDEKTQADYLVRSYVIALASGTEKVVWYDLMNDGVQADYNEHNFGLIRNALDAKGAYTPKPGYVSYAAMTRELAGATFVRKETAEGGIQSYLFDKDGEQVRVVWSLAPTSAAIRTDVPVAITDMMGNTETYAPYRGYVYWTLTGEPIYVKGNVSGVGKDGTFAVRGGPSAAGEPVALVFETNNAGTEPIALTLRVEDRTYEVQAAPGQNTSRELVIDSMSEPGSRWVTGYLADGGVKVGAFRYKVEAVQPFDVSVAPVFTGVEPMGKGIRLEVRNRSGTRELIVDKAEWKLGPLSGTEKLEAAVPPGGKRAYIIPAEGLATGETYAAEATVSFAGGGVYTYRGSFAYNPVYPNGDPAGETPVVDLARGTVKMTGYGGSGDLSGTVRLSYDADRFYLTADLQDDVHSFASSGSEIWRNDSIQFALASGVPGGSKEWYEYGLSQTTAGPLVYRWMSPAGVASGPVTAGTLQVTRDEERKRTTYALSLPWSELAPIEPGRDGVFSFSLLANDNDGSGRKGYIEWGSGIGGAKTPDLFRTMQWIVTDRTPPVTTASVEGVLRGGWYASDVTVRLSASDDRSTVAETVYSRDGGASWSVYREPLSVAEEGVHSIAFRSSDSAGNTEEARTVGFSIDTTPPVVTILGAGEYDVDQVVEATCIASDTGSGVVRHSCSEPLLRLPAYELELGDHALTATAEDAAGNAGAATAVVTVRVTTDGLARLTERSVSGPGANGVVHSLLRKLERGQFEAFRNEVMAQRGKKIEADRADLLAELADALASRPQGSVQAVATVDAEP